MKTSYSHISKVLIIRFSSIGDIVLTTPVVRCLKLQLKAEIHYLTKQAYLPLLEANPYLDRIYCFDKKLEEVLQKLRKERYDAIIDLHKNLRSLRVRLVLGARTLTFDKLNFEKWLLVNLKTNTLPEIHLVDRYMAAVAPLGVENDGEGLDFFLLPERTGTAQGLIPQQPYIAFAIGAAHQTKRLPAELAISVCQAIKKPVVLLGGKEEAAEGAEIARAAGAHVDNACGKLSLHGSALVIKEAQKVITHDTGMMHIAAAFQKRILSVWGNTVPDFGMYPYYGSRHLNKNTTFEVKNLSCRPCSKIGFDTCPKGHFMCMRNQDLATMAALANLDET